MRRNSHDPLSIAVVPGSTRPGRQSEQVASWACDQLSALAEHRANVEILDVAAFQLPLLDEPEPAAVGSYHRAHTRAWSAAVDRFDGFVFVTPEYNHGVPAALKNAIDYLFTEWRDKAAGFVSYGLHGGTRAVEQLRLTLAEVQVATVRSAVTLSLFTDFETGNPLAPGKLVPADHHLAVMERLAGELFEWSAALREVRRAKVLAP